MHTTKTAGTVNTDAPPKPPLRAPPPGPLDRPLAEPPLMVTVFGRTIAGPTHAHDEDAFLITNFAEGSPPIHEMVSPLALEVKERGILIGVSDGMGGVNAGEVASTVVLGSLWRGMSSVRADSAETALRGTIEAANQDVLAVANASGLEGMGATLTALLLIGHYAYVAEIGDSRAYLVRGNSILQLTRDQSYVQQLIDAGGLSREEAEESEFSHVILQAMGLEPDVDVVLTRVAVQNRDRFLLCSDGLSGPLSDPQMLDIVVASTSLSSACEQLIAAAVAGGGTDDITVVLAEVAAERAHTTAPSERLALATTQPLAPMLDAPVT
ncbi:MAG: serine/threonine-protein phosphatase [Myxococcales bacterium]|nr:serine/threonine-protein phosphatase [Myxococcales bacterium]